DGRPNASLRLRATGVAGGYVLLASARSPPGDPRRARDPRGEAADGGGAQTDGGRADATAAGGLAPAARAHATGGRSHAAPPAVGGNSANYALSGSASRGSLFTIRSAAPRGSSLARWICWAGK